MRSIFVLSWFKRGLRLSLVVGLAAAAWHAWAVFKRYDNARFEQFQSRLTYECAARQSEDELNRRMNGVGNINVNGLCSDRDFFVSPYELAQVRKGTMKFETTWKPFDWAGTAIAGILWTVGTILATLAVLGAVGLARWVWGRST
ncbi:MAG: hypothetical protein E5W72_13190 [Mesorhizobium sp.]|uniref:hypothetical protein n=1 Tax=Mesorhizobium sp. TaxID=1871066 RepID=UPI0012239D58|nr:hypothetical protein [Mesorhizobium sp.]TIT00219.1 MAG: hypothetical protein E5W87_19765 [Mesorhizobium sp.]TIT50625.1 MAG: hypothetical protein E5W72_13190 [Mesorhizobium sp.]